MKQIINQKEIQQCCVKITCGADQGTAFFVTSRILITAYHVVIENEDNGVEIKFEVDGRIVICKVLGVSKDFDICLLQSEVENSISMPLLSTSYRIAEQCEIAGFPYKQQSNFLICTGMVTQLLANERSDFKVSADELHKDFDYEGFSGGPVISSRRVTGIALKQIDNSITGISISKIEDFLASQGISFEEEYLYHKVPKEFQESIKRTSPNYKANDALDKALTFKGSWIVVQGTPGSGKTTIAATYNPRNENHIIFGHYFIKIPNDSRPSAVRISPQFFFETLENLFSNVLTGGPLSKKEVTFEERHNRFKGLIQDLDSYFQSKGQLGLLILDGIDEAVDIDNFLSPLPTDLGTNIRIIICCTSIAKIPATISVQLDPGNIVTVEPLALGQCESLIKTELQDLDLSVDLIQKLAIKSEGHPLYLRYLITIIKSSKSDSDEALDRWIESMPIISGDITRYYESIWASIYIDPGKLWILIVLSHLRQPIDKDTLYALLPNQIQLSFSSSYPSIAFLLTNEYFVQLYHTSFKEYILSKTEVDTKKANDLVIDYCKQFADSELAYNNIVFHLTRGSDPMSALAACTQDWADTCAVNDVAPDLVINDIKLCLTLSLQTKSVSEVIRLLLLLQRISFRYDSIFKENAPFLAQTLISLGKFKSALKYLVRDNTLLIGNNDAIFFLRQFYEADANEEASVLLEAIDRKYRKGIQEGFESDEGLDTRILILKLNSLTLFTNVAFKDAIRQWLYFQGQFRRMHDMAGEKSQINDIREYCAAWKTAYLIRQFNEYHNSQRIAEVTKFKITRKVATGLAKAAVIFDELNTYNSYSLKKGQTYSNLIKDLENVIENVGYNDSSNELFAIAKALAINSKNSGLSEKILNEYLSKSFDFHLREENGVDLNYSSVETKLFRSLCNGYVDSTNGYPTLAFKQPRYKYWEDYITSVLKLLGFIEGKFLSLKAKGIDTGRDQINKNLDVLIKGFNLTLDERSYWDRSYHIPEKLFPILINKLFNIINEHSPDRLTDAIKLFSLSQTSQFGLYTEGFRQCLFEAVTSCISYQIDKNIILLLVELWYNHVLLVENRWERTKELLKITEIYGLIKEQKSALEVFYEMLDTSMGPTWYKEAQLALVNDCLKLKPDTITLQKYLQEFAGILDFASGEMTFQQYVWGAKESFVGNLSRVKDLATAIEYFKFEVIPPPATLINNAEARTIDSPRIGDGYALGAANISEPSAVRSIIRQGISPYVRWFLSQVYVINDDTFRYLHDFALIQANCLNELQCKESFLEIARVQISTAIESEEVQESQNLYEYIRPLYRNLNTENKRWLRSIININIEWDRLDEPEHDPIGKKENSFDELNIEIASQKYSKQDLLSKGFSAFTKERVNIWYRNWSVASDTAKQSLKEILSTPEETLHYLRPFIEEYNDEYWSIASEILWFVRDLLPNDEKEKLLSLIAHHFNFIIRSDKRSIEKYSWLGKEEEPKFAKPDCLLIDFMIWLLNHPTQRISDKAYDSLLNLSAYEIEQVLSRIVYEIINNQPRRSTEVCGFLLSKIAQRNPIETIASLIQS